MKSGSAANDDHDDRDSSPSWPLRPSPRRGPSSFQSRPVGVIMQFGAGAGARGVEKRESSHTLRTRISLHFKFQNCCFGLTSLKIRGVTFFNCYIFVYKVMFMHKYLPVLEYFFQK